MNFFTKLENKLINFLTAICWWFDLRFNLKSKDLANPFMSLVGGCFYLMYTKETLGIFELFFSCSILSILNTFTGFGKEMRKDSDNSPNINKHKILWKLILVFTSSLFIIFAKDRSAPLLVFIMQISWFYVLCTEPMPPAEREKRLAKNKLNKLTTANQM